MGVSGGGGEPRWARVVDVEAVELIRLMVDGSRSRAVVRSASGLRGEAAPGGGQYC
jgi:hypothetical protein